MDELTNQYDRKIKVSMKFFIQQGVSSSFKNHINRACSCVKLSLHYYPVSTNITQHSRLSDEQPVRIWKSLEHLHHLKFVSNKTITLMLAYPIVQRSQLGESYALVFYHQTVIQTYIPKCSHSFYYRIYSIIYLYNFLTVTTRLQTGDDITM